MIKLGTFALALSLGACRGNPSAPAPTTAPEAAPTIGVAPVAVEAPDTHALQPATDTRSLVGRMNYEATHRPQVAITADKVLDVAIAAGLKLDSRKQYLGVTMKAAYCVGGTTADGIAVSACEFPTPESAVAGLAFMNEAFKNLNVGQRVAHSTTVLSIVGHDQNTPQIRDAFAKFAAL
jgi:hypothetical protein